jgi:ligand-binding sensor domain-containing protein
MIKMQIPKNPLFAILFVPIFFAACNGKISSNRSPTDSENEQGAKINFFAKKEQHQKIVRTMGTQSEVVHCEMVDRHGNIWFSISGEGAYVYDGKSFTNFSTKDGLCNNDVRAIIEDKAGNILFGTGQGICKYDGKKFSNIPATDTLMINCMLEDRDGHLWFGAMNRGAYRYDGLRLTNILNKYKHPILGDNQEKLIIDILQDKKGNIWFCSWNRGGAYRYDGTNLTHFLPSDDYYTFFEDERSNAYSSAVTKYVHLPTHISDDMIFSMTEDKAGNIWFATRRHGACRYDGKTFTSLGAKEGFPSINPYAILEDKAGRLWLTTDKDGVWCYDGTTFKNYNEQHGLVNNAVVSALEDKEGNLWFGTKWCGLSRYDGKTFTTFSQLDSK